MQYHIAQSGPSGSAINRCDIAWSDPSVVAAPSVNSTVSFRFGYPELRNKRRGELHGRPMVAKERKTMLARLLR